ncbi:phytoene dehydrogenase-like oxidoreductase [Metallosphaera yellowstonensis MK1]|jgi:phytoene dehydrogenase-like protein|uniref:Pyridine nucleotide-disulfide oxidoreductase domain-containing protein 2 n=1 Tax=Metallosphaera yellowstonensis MK1 TaxID=671065 RepID=H2C322_9CREN|nr:NAD(P)/FAD-dependent oxidoreductase [Metallosphaera yellowstonensis]EHP70643.1 phytoene dehydrogenase-like oxidoreductase [Metallosphaera yellowstonensis MK1]
MYDVIVVGGGHNGLVASAYLAMNGLRVAVFERRDVVGGASVTEELWPGVKVSTGAYVLSLLRPRIIRDLKLEERGLEIITKDPGLFVPFGSGKSLYIWNDVDKTKREISKFSTRDASAYEKWIKFWEPFYLLADTIMLNPPPSIQDLEALIPLLKSVSTESPKDLLEALKTLVQDASSLLDTFFESDEVKAALVEDAVVGTYASPSTPGTAYVLAHHVLGEVNGIKGAWGYVRGGMGGVTAAMRRAAESFGVEVYTGSPVEKILVKGGRVTGVLLKGGKVIESRVVLSNADPRFTFTKLLEGVELDQEFVRKVRSLKGRGVSFKVVGYIEELPDFGHGKSLSPEHIASELILPSVDYVEKAYLDAKVRGFSREPWLSINIQSSVDPTLAPPGKFSFSIFGQYLPYRQGLDEMKDEIYQLTMDKIREYAPNFKPVRYEVITPLDIEKRFGITEGNIFHLDMTPDQLYSFRPIPGYDYNTPVKGFYLCGSGTHPGGGVTGAPGFNAAMRVINDMRAGKS